MRLFCAFGDWLASSSEKPIHLRVGKTRWNATSGRVGKNKCGFAAKPLMHATRLEHHIAPAAID
jgi:hypothetical protein